MTAVTTKRYLANINAAFDKLKIETEEEKDDF